MRKLKEVRFMEEKYYDQVIFRNRVCILHVKRDIAYLEEFMSDGYAPEAREIPLLLTIFKLYEQQQYMYDNKVHSVENRIVSISQPWIRPIVRGKLNFVCDKSLVFFAIKSPFLS